MEARATEKYIRTSPRKMRLIIDVVRGMKVDRALAVLKFMPSPAAKAVSKAVASAAASAENNYQMVPMDLHITTICVDEGPTLKRFRSAAHGRAHPILKRSSHITVSVGDKEV
ncbi:MAG: 50S ribosomal protein L22 [Dehalococcoidia bacterium]|nr:50S ribosomal protein L22 [Dehalococcoidia bacterium]